MSIKRYILGLGMTSRLIVSGLYDRQIVKITIVYTELEAKDVYWRPHIEKGMQIPEKNAFPLQCAMGHLNIQDPPLRLTGRHPRPTGGSIFGGVVPLCMEIQPAFSIPPPARGL